MPQKRLILANKMVVVYMVAPLPPEANPASRHSARAHWDLPSRPTKVPRCHSSRRGWQCAGGRALRETLGASWAQN